MSFRLCVGVSSHPSRLCVGGTPTRIRRAQKLAHPLKNLSPNAQFVMPSEPSITQSSNFRHILPMESHSILPALFYFSSTSHLTNIQLSKTSPHATRPCQPPPRDLFVVYHKASLHKVVHRITVAGAHNRIYPGSCGFDSHLGPGPTRSTFFLNTASPRTLLGSYKPTTHILCLAAQPRLYPL